MLLILSMLHAYGYGRMLDPKTKIHVIAREPGRPGSATI